MSIERKSGRKRTLHAACREGHLGKVRFLLDSSNIESSGGEDKSPLWVACSENHVSVAEYLIEKGAKLEKMYEIQGSSKVRRQALTALGLACRMGYLAIVKLLHGADANIDRVSNDGSSALMVAIEGNQVEVIRFLLNRAVDVTVKNDLGNAAIHVAAKQEDLDKEILRFLMHKGGVDVEARTSDGYTALHVACMHGLYENALYLLELGASIHTLDQHGNTALHWACTSPVYLQPMNQNVNAESDGTASPDLVEHLIREAGADVNIKSSLHGTPLHCACRDYANIKIITTLLDYGADIDAKDDCGYTSLYLAYQSEHMGIVDLVIQRGANVNAHNGYERTTVLHKACFDCHRERERIVDFIDAGADLLARNRFQWTVLHFCIRSYAREWTETLRLILNQIYFSLGDEAAQKFINEQDSEGCTALYYACKAGGEQKASMLLDHGACPNIHGHTLGASLSPAFVALVGNFQSVVFLLLRRGAWIDAPNRKEQCTLLQYACMHGYIGMIQFLIGEAASLEKRTRFGWNAVHYAAAGGHCDGLRLLLDLCCELRGNRLPENGLIETQEFSGATPIHIACRAGHFGTTQLLLEKGASPICIDHSGMLAVEKAAKRGDHSTTFMMLNAMAGRDWFRDKIEEPAARSSTRAFIAHNSSTTVLTAISSEDDGEFASEGDSTLDSGFNRFEKVKFDQKVFFDGLPAGEVNGL
ncbi:hypothetical protein ACA910_005762 [Epithemia clementina (nom. ined.)]